MLEDLLNWQWRALIQSLRGSRLFSLPKIRNLFARKLGQGKPSLAVAIGKRRKGNALEEYRRRFALPAGQGNGPIAPPGDQDFRQQPARPDRDRARQPEHGEKAKARLQTRTRSRQRRRGSGHFFGVSSTLFRLILLRGYYGVAGIKFGRNAWIAVTAACAIVFGGAYVYRTVKADSGGSFHAAQPSDEKPELADGRPNGNKRYYDRLTPDESQTANAPAPSQPVAAEPVSSEPTVVRSETYLPDGTRTDIAPPAPVPGIVKLAAEQARPAILGAAAEPPAAPALGAAPQANSAPAEGPAVQAPESVQPSDNGYFAQVKSDQDERAAKAELVAVVEKYKAVLGEVPLITRSVDLKAKGIWFRVLAGPVKSRDEAESLCKKLKSAGLQACIVQRFD